MHGPDFIQETGLQTPPLLSLSFPVNADESPSSPLLQTFKNDDVSPFLASPFVLVQWIISDPHISDAHRLSLAPPTNLIACPNRGQR